MGEKGQNKGGEGRQEAQLSQIGCATVSVAETLKCSLEVIKVIRNGTVH